MSTEGKRATLCCVFLLALTWLVFGQTLSHEFINYDDETYVYKNPQVIDGLTLHGIAWAFTSTRASNWHPLTWLSHMLDCQLFGLRAGGHHFTNVVLHSLAVLLLFLGLRQMSGATFRSAFVAALFAIHPLRVESVAWVAERKDVLSGVFFMLTLLLYSRYARERGPGRYFLVMLCFALGLMAKPMLITVPLILLLLDYWPLNRFVGASLTSLILEKVPLFVMSGASAIVTLFAQKEAIAGLENLPWPWRINNALVSYVIYLWQLIWTVNLTVLYPHKSAALSPWSGVLSLVLLVAITVWTIVQRRKYPYAFTGWFWYLIMLLPVIGLIQVGAQAHADRYTYLPHIGLYLFVTWIAVSQINPLPRGREILATVGAIALIVLSCCAWRQTSFWKDGETLWRRALAINPNNNLAENNLGNVLLRRGLVDEAVGHYERAIALYPHYDMAHYNLGNALFKRGDTAAAIEQYRTAVALRPTYAEAENGLGDALLKVGSFDDAAAHYQAALGLKSGRSAEEIAKTHFNLANALLQKGEVDQAIGQLEEALALEPDGDETRSAQIEYNLGNAFRRKRQNDEAIPHYQKAIELNSAYEEAHYNLANSLLDLGQTVAAVSEYKKALELRPNYPEAQNNLGNAFIQAGQVPEAIAQYQEAVSGSPGSALFAANLASAYAAAKDWKSAGAAAKHALELTPATNTALIKQLNDDIELYGKNANEAESPNSKPQGPQEH